MFSPARAVDRHPGAVSLLGMTLIALGFALGVGVALWYAVAWPAGLAGAGAALLGGVGVGAMFAARCAEPNRGGCIHFPDAHMAAGCTAAGCGCQAPRVSAGDTCGRAGGAA